MNATETNSVFCFVIDDVVDKEGGSNNSDPKQSGIVLIRRCSQWPLCLIDFQHTTMIKI